MAFYTLIGLLVVAAILGVGVYWLLSNVTFKRQSERYTYMTDESVQDNYKDEQSDPKA